MKRLALLLALPACATVFDPGPDLLAVRSEPTGALVFVDGLQVGQTPAIVRVPRGIESWHTVELRKPGCEPRHFTYSKVANGIALLGGPLALVDLLAGNAMKFPEGTELVAHLAPER